MWNILWSAEHSMKCVLRTVLIRPDLSQLKAPVMRNNMNVAQCKMTALHFLSSFSSSSHRSTIEYLHISWASPFADIYFGLVINDISLSGGYKRFGRKYCLYLQGWLCDNIPNLHGHENKVRCFFQILMRRDIWNHFYTRFILCHFDSHQWPLRNVFFKSRNELEV